MPVRKADAVWEGNLKEGKGRMKLGSSAFEGAYSFSSRFEEGTGTNPEELIGAALAGCFSMALANGLAQDGFSPRRIHSNASVKFEKLEEGFKITSITLDTEAEVPGIDEKVFLDKAEATKKTCPVSKALTGTEIKLNARLISK
ncbi:MAG: OsmC family protein [Nitrospirae bacterium]|nr:OsmC family protein [Nitrospirota bacterium]